MKVRNLCLGSVNSLSFEEEEKKENVNHRNMQLHEMLTDCLQEQVSKTNLQSKCEIASDQFTTCPCSRWSICCRSITPTSTATQSTT